MLTKSSLNQLLLNHLVNVIQLTRCNLRDSFWLGRMNLDRKVRQEVWIFRPLCCEVWKRSNVIFWGNIAPALGPFQNKNSSFVLLLLGTVNSELKLLQNGSKNRFWGKRTTIIHRQGNSTFIYIQTKRYIALGESNGKSSTFPVTPA